MGEDRSDGTNIRYFYDIDGLCGIRYNGINYNVVRNAYGDIITIICGDDVVTQYFYDAWGNCQVKQFNDTRDIGKINPFRWKGHYYDVESGLDDVNGSYYDPEVGLHVDAAAVSTLIDNAFELFGLDMNGIMCDNILAYSPYIYSVFTTLELNANPLYDPDYNKPWWELAWRAVVNWFASVVQWFNELDIGIKIGIGIVLLALACIITAAVTIGTGGTGTAALAAVGNVLMQFAIGVVSMATISVVIAAVSGEDIVDSLTQGIADGIFWGGVFAFVSAGVNAVKAAVRYLNNTTKIYRAISVEELESLKQTKMFSVKEGAFEGKQFGLKLREVKSYANLNFNDGVYSHIVKTRIPNSVLNSFTKTATDAFVFKSGVITVTSEQLKILNRTMFYIKYIKL